MVSKADTDLCAGDHYGTPGKTLSHTDNMSTKIDELLSNLRVLFAEQTFDLAMAMAELANVAAERDKLKAELDTARQSLRAAEADADETESVNSDLRTVNRRLVADLAAAMQRAATAEELFACAGLRGRY